MTNSPLGQYAPLVASVVCVGTIAVFLFASLFQVPLSLPDATVTSLRDFAILAFGAVVGSAVAVNGWKQPLASAHERIDKLEAESGVATHDLPTGTV